MKKMIFLAMSVVCVGQLVGMEQSRSSMSKIMNDKKVQELYDAVLFNTSGTFSFDDPALSVRLTRARNNFQNQFKEATTKTAAHDLINDLKEAIDTIVDPKRNASLKLLNNYTKQKLNKALMSLSELKGIL